MFYVITEDEILKARNLKAFNKRHQTKFMKEDFRRSGRDFIIDVSPQDLEFKKDLAQLDQVAISGLYKKDNTMTFLIVNIVFTSITMLNAITANSNTSTIVKILQKLAE